MYLAVVQQQVVDVPSNSWIGQMSMAGVGIAILLLSALCIKGRKKKTTKEPVSMGPWSPLVTSIGTRLIEKPTARVINKWSGKDPEGGDSEGLDWKSLMTFTFGIFGMTAILSSTPSTLLSLVHWFQGLISSVGSLPLIEDFGAAGICIVLGFMALRSRDDDMKDLIYGALCGLVWPLGGGTWAEVTLNVGQWVPQVLQIS